MRTERGRRAGGGYAGELGKPPISALDDFQRWTRRIRPPTQSRLYDWQLLHPPTRQRWEGPRNPPTQTLLRSKLDAERPVPRNPREACQDRASAQRSGGRRRAGRLSQGRDVSPKLHSAVWVRGGTAFVRGGRETGFRSRRHSVVRQHGSPLLDEIYRSVGRRRRLRGKGEKPVFAKVPQRRVGARRVLVCAGRARNRFPEWTPFGAPTARIAPPRRDLAIRGDELSTPRG